jgi:hypothetical protein
VGLLLELQLPSKRRAEKARLDWINCLRERYIACCTTARIR